MARHRTLDRILDLHPKRDNAEIYYLMAAYEFPFDMTRALEFALYRTYAVPSIGGLLDRTEEFNRRVQKRYDDTDLILSEIVDYGYESERGRLAIARMNQIHGRFPIANEDFLYVLSTVAFEPIRWIDRYGWRPLTEKEKLAAFYFWREVGARMNIRDIPETQDEFEAYNLAYERERFAYTESARRVAEATRDMFLDWFLPRSLHPIGRPAIYALMDDPLLEAFRFPRPPDAIRNLVHESLRLRSRVVAHLPERRTPQLRTEMRHRSYPQGYTVAKLGPPRAPDWAKDP
jgi:hypothetical protein